MPEYSIVHAGIKRISAAFWKALLIPRSGIFGVTRWCPWRRSRHQIVLLHCTRSTAISVTIVIVMPSQTKRRCTAWGGIHARARPVCEHISTILIKTIRKIVRTRLLRTLPKSRIVVWILQVWAGFRVFFVLLLVQGRTRPRRRFPLAARL